MLANSGAGCRGVYRLAARRKADIVTCELLAAAPPPRLFEGPGTQQACLSASTAQCHAFMQLRSAPGNPGLS